MSAADIRETDHRKSKVSVETDGDSDANHSEEEVQRLAAAVGY